jgi:hypothetical protein
LITFGGLKEEGSSATDFVADVADVWTKKDGFSLSGRGSSKGEKVKTISVNSIIDIFLTLW